MIKSSFLLAVFFLTCMSILAQSANPFKKYSFDENYTIVGLGLSESVDSYQKFSFILKDTADFNLLKKTWNFNKRSDFYLQQDYFEIYILKGKEIKDRITVNPEHNNILIDGNWYYFDNSLLEALHEKSPLDYRIKQTSFRSEKLSRAYSDSIRKDNSLLLVFEPYYQRKYEGQFYITYSKSKAIPDFKVATKVAQKLLDKKANAKEFSVVYELSDYNVAHEDKFQITVETSKLVYDKTIAVGFDKSDWQEREFEVTSYWLGSDEKTKGLVSKDLKQNEASKAPQIPASAYDRFNMNTVERMPEYPGGMTAFYDYVANEYKWPKEAVSAQVSGKIVANFIIEKDGSITDITIVEDLGYGMGEELMRVLRNSKKWKPGKQDGRNVRVSYTLPLNLSPRPPERTYAVFPAHGSTSQSMKLPALEVPRTQYYFENKINKCGIQAFVDEDGKQALGDRYSILNYVVGGLPADTLAKITGRISYQVVIDSTGKCCTVSFKNESNLSDKSLKIDEILDSKTLWNVLPSKNGKKEAVSALLVFTFTLDKAKYQHMVFEKNSDKLVELEYSEKSKVGRW